MKKKILIAMFIAASFFVTKAQIIEVASIVNENNSYGTFGNFTANTKSDWSINNTQFASINNSNEPCNLSQQSSYNNLKFELNKNVIFEKEISYANKILQIMILK